jgi:levanase
MVWSAVAGLALVVAASAAPILPCLRHEELRPQFHFIPQTGWMNGEKDTMRQYVHSINCNSAPCFVTSADPNGPFFDPLTETYHFFYQANSNVTCGMSPWDTPTLGPKWSGMRWGHAVSKDMLGWTHLPVALNHWDNEFFDCDPPQIFSGSVTMAADGNPIAFYAVPCQNWINAAVPKNRSDPLLVEWEKLGPIMNASDSVTKGNGKGAGQGGYDWGTTFRDPTEAWKDPNGSDGAWLVAAACMNGTCLFKSNDSSLRTNWESAGWLRHIPSSGVWECPDVFQLPGTDKFVLKANTAQGNTCKGGPSCWWTLGEFDKHGIFVPLSEDICGGLSLNGE